MNRSIFPRSSSAFRAITVPLGFIGAWAIYASANASPYFPPPSDIVAAATSWLHGAFWIDASTSVSNLAVGYFVATAMGGCLGVLAGTQRLIRESIMPLADFLRSIPVAAIIPLFLFILGIGDATQVGIIVIAAFWPILLATVDGVVAIKALHLDVARVFHVTGALRLLRITIPASSPMILAGMKTGLGFAVAGLVISEMVAAPAGLGQYVLRSQRIFDLAGVWTGTIALGLLGFIASAGFEYVERRLLKWRV